MTYVVIPNLSVIHGLQCTALNWAVTRRVGRAWINATVLKTVEQKCSVGSNPTLSSIWRISLKVKHYEVQHTGSTPEIRRFRVYAVEDVGSTPTFSTIYGRLAEPGLLHLFAKEALSKKQS